MCNRLKEEESGLFSLAIMDRLLTLNGKFRLLLVWWMALCPKSSVHAFSTKFRHHVPLVHLYASATPPAKKIVFSDDNRATTNLSEQPQPCFWKPSWKGGKWQRRIHLDDLKVGQKLQGSFVQELLDGKTGPKLFFEVGVGRTDSKGQWSIVNGMLRLERAKQSVVRKRAARLRQKEFVDLWVSRVQAGCGRLEVCLDEEKVQKYQQDGTKIPVSSLARGKEVQGRVMRILPYGVMVDVGANRLGLLHIRRVRELYGKYIDKEQGLIDAGLEKGAQVRLSVDNVNKRRLSLDFTEDVKGEAKELETKNAKATMQISNSGQVQEVNGMSAEELAEWAAFAARNGEETEAQGGNEEGDDDYDEYDEEREIEESLGLGYY